MGSGSKIVKQHNLIKRKDAWVIFGGHIRHKKMEKPYGLEYYPLNDAENTYVGIHPLNETETNIYVFQGRSNTMGNPAELVGKFKEVIREIQPDSEKIQNLGGTIASGSLKKYALNNIIFFGAAGMLNPDGCGMGFNEILKQHRTFSIGITKAMEKKTLNEKTLV